MTRSRRHVLPGTQAGDAPPSPWVPGNKPAPTGTGPSAPEPVGATTHPNQRADMHTTTTPRPQRHKTIGTLTRIWANPTGIAATAICAGWYAPWPLKTAAILIGWATPAIHDTYTRAAHNTRLLHIAARWPHDARNAGLTLRSTTLPNIDLIRPRLVHIQTDRVIRPRWIEWHIEPVPGHDPDLYAPAATSLAHAWGFARDQYCRATLFDGPNNTIILRIDRGLR